ncbi:MAG: hypothetical protein CM15mV81_170 [uncultured marine virus]|nr:MAG: hypothetical protein CM15mV81_170 [uncultured marine virus]
MHEVTYAQSGDVMFIAHQTFMVRKLVRTGLTSFQMETKTFDTQSAGAKIYQPYFQFQDLGVTLIPFASSGMVKPFQQVRILGYTGLQTGNYLIQTCWYYY